MTTINLKAEQWQNMRDFLKSDPRAYVGNEDCQLLVQNSKAFHDRFLCVADEWWHIGHSFKDLGGKDSMINKIDGQVALKKLRERVQQEINVAQEFCT